MSEPEVVVVADPAAATTLAASDIADALRRAVDTRGRADWATTGGSTPVGIYRALSVPPMRDTVPWPAVHVWWGDDRYVPRDHPLSNVKPLDEVLRVPLPTANLHPFPVDWAIAQMRGATWAAAWAADDLRSAGLPTAEGWPVLDLILLGIGGDGHLLSVFPGSAAFDSPDWALAVPAPTHIEPHVERVTLNPAIVGAARQVIVVVSGGGKAPILAEIFGAECDPHRWPAQLARRVGATWIIDEAAAANLPG